MPPPTDPKLTQLQHALAQGVIDQATFDAANAGINAQLAGSGAIAQGTDALALGGGAVLVQGNNPGTINLGVLIQQAAQPGATGQDLRRAYLARLLQQADQLPLFAGDNNGAPILLSSVYTALLTQRSTGERQPQPPGAGGLSGGRATHPPHLSALDVLNAERHLVLLGGPGSGKSSFVSFVALSLAGELLGAARPNLAALTAPLPPEDDTPGDQPNPPQQWRHGPLLPVLVVLRDLASQLPPPGQPVDTLTIWAYITQRLQAAALADYAPHLQQELLQTGGLILFDGLDEVPDALQRRAQIKQAVQAFAATFQRCRFLVTSRTYAYQRQDWALDGFVPVQLQPLTTGQMRAFVQAWYAHMVDLGRLTPSAAQSRSQHLLHQISRNPRLRELADQPLLLTLIAQLQTKPGGALPDKREALYDKAVEMLLDTWEGTKPRQAVDGSRSVEPSLAEWLSATPNVIRQQLNRLAFEAHRDQQALTGTADIPQDTLTTALRRASSNPDTRLLRLEEYLRDRAGLLAAHGVGLYQFPHRSFQEYLAACHLTDDDFPETLARLARSDANRWREVALLAGAKAARGVRSAAWDLADALCVDASPASGTPAQADQWGALLAGQVLVESADLAQVAPRHRAVLQRVRDWQLVLMRRGNLPAAERALAGRSLAALGDPRPEVMTLEGMQFCPVPAGAFWMGDDEDDDAKPLHRVELAYAYCIGRYPVTVAQWRAFVAMSGQAPDGADSLQGRDNDPVTNVTWHDAQRFCQSLTEAWQSQLPAGWVVALPTEAEWEKAARGGDSPPSEKLPVVAGPSGLRLPIPSAVRSAVAQPARCYPWGDDDDITERANAEQAIGETSAAGCYPAGASAYGCEDMSGNVWEWTTSLWGVDLWNPTFKYPYEPSDQRRDDPASVDDVRRVVRGGSWGFRRGYARCAFRSRGRPVFRVGDLGFRVVLRSAPVFPPP